MVVRTGCLRACDSSRKWGDAPRRRASRSQGRSTVLADRPLPLLDGLYKGTRSNACITPPSFPRAKAQQKRSSNQRPRHSLLVRLSRTASLSALFSNPLLLLTGECATDKKHYQPSKSRRTKARSSGSRRDTPHSDDDGAFFFRGGDGAVPAGGVLRHGAGGQAVALPAQALRQRRQL